MFKLYRDLRRKYLSGDPFPEEWLPIIDDRLPFARELTGEERDRFLDRLHVFVRDKSWVAAGGLEAVTDEMKVVIAGCAARLVRNLPLDAYDRLSEVVVYPKSFTGEQFEDGEVLGLAHPWGTVVLSWDAVRRGIATSNDARDTAVHEFAHALDVEDGLYDGTPLLESGADYRDWVRVLGRHFARMKEAPKGDVLREYGATNEAEFFAVATEAFFEQPQRLQRRAPELYDQLRDFYEIDPASPAAADDD